MWWMSLSIQLKFNSGRLTHCGNQGARNSSPLVTLPEGTKKTKLVLSEITFNCEYKLV